MGIPVDTNAGDLELATEEFKYASRLAEKWKVKAGTVPTHAYGVEWILFNPESEEPKSLMFFEHRPAGEEAPYLVRASRVAVGGRMAMILGIPLIAVILSGKGEARYAKLEKEAIAQTIANRYAVRQKEGTHELMLEIPADLLREFKG